MDLPGNGKNRQSWKYYYINSNTLLLDRVQYKDTTGATVVTVIEWAQTAGEWAPSSVSRFESGKEVLKVAVTSAAVLAAQSPSVYSNGASKP